MSNYNKLSDVVQESISKSPATNENFQKFAWGLQIGAGINIFGKIAMDEKYEF